MRIITRLFLAGVVLAAAVEADPITIDMNSVANRSYQLNQRFVGPTGNVTYGTSLADDVPFAVANGSFSYWVGSDAQSDVTIPINVTGVDKAWTLLNSLWGQAGPASYISLTFNGSAGDHYTVKLVEGVDIRDFNNGPYVNTLSSPNAEQVFSTTGADGREVRLDRQTWELPAEFLSETLVSVTLADTGAQNFERAMLSGITVNQVSTGTQGGSASATPEPGSFILFCGAAVVLFGGMNRYKVLRKDRAPGKSGQPLL